MADEPNRPDQPVGPASKGPFRLTDFCPQTAEQIEQKRERRVLWVGRTVIIALTLTFVGLIGRV